MQGAKVQLRELRRTDLDTVWRWRNDPEITDFLSNLSIARLQIDAWFREYEGSANGHFFAIETSEGKFIGYTGLRDIDPTNRTATMDIIIGEKSYWSQGFGQDAVRTLLHHAFEDLGLEKVDLTVLPFNGRGIRCYEKCGFRRTGFHPQKYLRRGRMWQPVHMEITRTQFELAEKVRPS